MQQVRRRQQREASIVANAARYIDALHATILARVANGTLSIGESMFPVPRRRVAPSIVSMQRFLIPLFCRAFSPPSDDLSR